MDAADRLREPLLAERRSARRPGRPALVAPAAGADGITATPAFSWEPAADAAFYRFTLSASEDLSDPIVETTGLTATTVRPDVDLAPRRATPGR